MSLVKISGGQYLNRCCQWFGRHSSNQNVSISQQPPIPKEDVHTRLRTLFCDYAEDLIRISYVSLRTGKPISVGISVALMEVQTEFAVSSGFTDLCNIDVLRILCLFLSSPYKRPNPTRLGNVAPLELVSPRSHHLTSSQEQLEHMRCLFNSKVHGFSITR